MKISLLLLFSLLFMLTSCKNDDEKDDPKDTLNSIAYYSFVGNSDDISGNNNNAEMNGASLTKNRKGKNKTAIELDGDNDYLLVDNILNVQRAFSFAGWYYLSDDADNWNSFFTKGTYCEFGVMYRNFLDEGPRVIRVFNGTCEGIRSDDLEITLPTNRWFHFAFTYNAQRIRIWIDGVVANEYDYSESIEDGNNFYIGSASNDVGRAYFWEGKLDEIGIYNYELLETDINKLMQY